MKTVSKLVFLCLLTTTILQLSRSDEIVADDADVRFHAPGASREEEQCEYRRQIGTCKRRSQCSTPTRRICRYGFNPVVCCMDKVTTQAVTMRPPTRPPRTTKRQSVTTKRPLSPTRLPAPKPEEITEMDITFPGCGSRSPSVPSGRSASETEPTTPPSPRRRTGGIFSRRGKREAHPNWIWRSRRQIKPVIVGGNAARANSWPWMVAVFKQSVAGGPKGFLCGASLISRRYVLCAAHCFDAEKGNIVPSKFSIIVGSHSTKDGTEYPLESITIHSQYRAPQYYNDISLLKLKRDATLTKKVYPVCLPSESLRSQIRPDKSDVTVTGWGDTSFGGVSSKVLHEVTLPIVPLRDCNASYAKVAKSNFPRGISNEFMCAGLKEGGKDACQGDSGGPMVMKLASETYVQLGVVSFGFGCAKAGFPGVYTRVSKYSKWIYDNTDLGVK